jgi:hypothetical protein
MDTGTQSRFRIHLGLVIAEAICIPAFIFETFRALHGNILSWAYVIEWPVLAGYAVYMWAKMLREERGDDARSRARRARAAVPAADDDPELRAWNDYLATVHKPQAQPDAETRDA